MKAERDPAEVRGIPEYAGRILIVEDDSDNAESIAKILECWGYQTRIEADSLAALEAMQSFVPDLVLLDLGLPSIDGYEVAKRIRRMSRFARTPIACVTAHGFPEHRRKSAEAGCNAHLLKPVDYDELKKMIAIFLAQSAKRANATAEGRTDHAAGAAGG